jgi:sugar phosphate isomerase/epimerase
MHRRTFLQTLAASLPAAAAAKVKASQIGANTAIKGYSFVQAVDLLKKIGFPIIEIHPMGKPGATPGEFPGFTFDKLTEQEKAAMKAALKGVPHITAHLPYTGHDYFAKDEAVAEAAVKVVDTALEGSAYFGAEVCVFHPKPGGGQTLESQWPVMLQRIRRWGDLAKRHNIRIALETGYPPSIKDYIRLIKEVDHPAVGATIDVGHQSKYAELVAKVRPEDRGTPAGIRAYNDTTLAITEALGPKAFHFHIHDIEPATWAEHKPLGLGFVDYPRLFALLNKINFSGYLVFEIGGEPSKIEGYLRDGKKRIETLLTQSV